MPQQKIQGVNPVTSANEAAERVWEQAEIAAGQSCYGIGGMIVENKTGRIIKAWGNRAQGQLKSGEYYPLDPSNHGETQLVRWYYDNQRSIKKDLGYLPKPSDLTVVTSLDPCAMCAGGLCAAGFNVGVIAPDDSGGGVNWDNSGAFPNAPTSIQEQLKSLFGYYKAEGIGYRKIYQGNQNLLFSTETLSQKVFQANADAFTNSAAQVSKTRKEARINPKDLKDPTTLPTNNATVLALKERFPEALTLRLTEKADISASGLNPEDVENIYYQPSLELYRRLQEAVTSEPGAENAVAVVDRFGNLLTIGVDKPSEGPIETALLNAVSDYSRFLFDLISEASDAGIPFQYKQSDAYQYLSSAADSTYIYLRCPSAGEAQTLKDLGLFGSASEDVIQYIETPKRGTKLDFENQVRGLPIYYLQSERVSPVQSVPEEAVLVVSTNRDSGPGSLRSAIAAANSTKEFKAIEFATDATIHLRSRLPKVNSPIDISITPAIKQARINFNGFDGLFFGKQSSGSSIRGVQLSNASGYAITTRTPHLQLSDLQFGNAKAINQKGSIRDPLGISPKNLKGWNSSQAELHPMYKIDIRPIQIKANNTLVSTVRTDDEKETILFGFKDPISQGSATLSNFSPAQKRALSQDTIEESLKLGRASKAVQEALAKKLGGQQVNLLSEGQWLPQAQLKDGTELTLTWLEQTGSAVRGEFRLSMEKIEQQPSLSSLLGKTYTFNWTLPNPGTNTRAQKGEVAVTTIRNTQRPIKIGFYRVDDPLTGEIGGVVPNDPDYAKLALKRARQSKLMLSDRLTGLTTSTSNTTSLKNMDPTKSYGIVADELVGAKQPVTSYSHPKDGLLYPFQTFQLSHDRVAVGVEASPSAHRGDFADLIFTLPDNIAMATGGWL
jgi:tRNA(Arg) A34 adenosine deaminase TadA